jgi:hypothetical protein
MLEYPKALYKKGEELVWEGRQLAITIVHDAEAEAKAIADGWHRVESVIEGALETVKADADEVVQTVKAAVKRKAK